MVRQDKGISLTVKVLFTSGNSALSKAIKRATGEDCSHVAIQLWNGLVVHSNLLGIHLNSLEYFKKKAQIVYEIDMGIDPPKERLAFQKISKYEGQSYDLLALFWLALLSIYPFRKNNQWQDSNKFTCTEFVTEVILGQADSLITPYQLYLKLKEMKTT